MSKGIRLIFSRQPFGCIAIEECIMKTLSMMLMVIIANIYLPNAYAACIRADFTGVWRLFSDDTLCTLIIPATGTTISSSSRCYTLGKPARVLSETLTMTSACQLTGRIRVGSDSIQTISAWISKGKDSISGYGYRSVADNFHFSWVKQ